MSFVISKNDAALNSIAGRRSRDAESIFFCQSKKPDSIIDTTTKHTRAVKNFSHTEIAFTFLFFFGGGNLYYVNIELICCVPRNGKKINITSTETKTIFLAVIRVYFVTFIKAYDPVSSEPRAEIIRSRLRAWKIFLARLPLFPRGSSRSRSLYQINDSRFVWRFERVRGVEARRKKGR